MKKMVLLPMMAVAVERCFERPCVQRPHSLVSEIVQISVSGPFSSESIVSGRPVAGLCIFPEMAGSYCMAWATCWSGAMGTEATTGVGTLGAGTGGDTLGAGAGEVGGLALVGGQELAMARPRMCAISAYALRMGGPKVRAGFGVAGTGCWRR